MSINIITISREFGSGGRTIAEIVAEKLGYSFYDKELIARAAERTGFAESFVQEHGEKLGSRFFSVPYASNTFNGMTTEDYLWSMQRNIILELADEGPCVIVGRCSDYILRNANNHFSIFIYASKEARLENCIKTLHMTKEEAESMIEEVDEARASYNMHYAKAYSENVEYKDILIDSGLYGSVEDTADILVTMIRKKFNLAM